MTPPEYGVVYKYLAAGSLRALAVMATSRLKEFSDVPTTVEIGYPNLLQLAIVDFPYGQKLQRKSSKKQKNSLKRR